MKILREYIWDTLRQNKRSSVIIMISLFLMTSLMSCFCGLVYTMWTDAVVLEKWHNGDWHGELFDNTPGKDLEFIKNYASVSATLIKGEWKTARISDEGKRIYLLFRGANQEYWDSMPEKETITDGRLPSAENELVLSKQYFEDYPDAKIGDTLTLPLGQRVDHGRICLPTEIFREGETFQETETKTYTIVGIMDVTTTSAVPAYSGMTWLDEASIEPDDHLTVYLRFDPVRRTYQDLPALASAIGYETDEYDNYQLRYNTGLLSTYGILSPENQGLPAHISMLAVPAMFLLFCAFLVAVFILIIHNAFTMSVNEKLQQIGTLAGIGASPRQIREMVLCEALLLSLVPLPPGIFAGWLLDRKLFQLINATNDLGRNAPDIILTFGLPAILPAVFLSLLTVWLSAGIPAGKTARLLPIEILKQEGTLKEKKRQKKSTFHFTGIIGELASNAVSARRASYRTATVSLCLSFLLLTVFQYIVTVNHANDEIFRASPAEEGHIFLSVSDGQSPDPEALEQIKSVPGIGNAVIENSMRCAIWVDPEVASDDIKTSLGGFEEIVAKKKYSPILQNGQCRIASVVIGLEKDSFQNYCRQLGISACPYFEDPEKALVYNYTKDPENSTRRNVLKRQLLKLHPGQKLTFTEKDHDEIEGNFEFTLTAEKLVDTLPMGNHRLSAFTLVLIMPMEHVLELGTHCCEKRQASTKNISATFWTEDVNASSMSTLKQTTANLEETVSLYYGSGDYLLSNLAEREEMQAGSAGVLNLVVLFLTGFLAAIGLSNVWASIFGNLRRRRQEFAMLKSAGLSPKQLWRMLLLEGFTLGIRPLLLSIPVQAAVLAALLYITEISLPEYLPFAPCGILLAYTGLILLAVIGAYAFGGQKLQKENIITTIRDETI